MFKTHETLTYKYKLMDPIMLKPNLMPKKFDLLGLVGELNCVDPRCLGFA